MLQLPSTNRRGTNDMSRVLYACVTREGARNPCPTPETVLSDFHPKHGMSCRAGCQRPVGASGAMLHVHPPKSHRCCISAVQC